MSHFPHPHSEGTDTFERRLIDDWQWTYQKNGVKDHFFIPGSTKKEDVIYEPSIPTIFESAVPEDRLLSASLPHDVIYKLKGDLTKPSFTLILREYENGRLSPVQKVSKLYADEVFDAILEEIGVWWWRRKLAWCGIRSFVAKRAWEEEDDFHLPKIEKPHPKLR